MVVVPEIESWYLAGLDAECNARLGIGEPATTDQITKERFEQLQPGRFDSKLDFVLEILDCFSVEAARGKNRIVRLFLPQILARRVAVTLFVSRE